MGVSGIENTERPLREVELSRVVEGLLTGLEVDGKRVLVLVPDGTRTAPIPDMFRLIHGALSGRVSELNFLIALGTHRAMIPDGINRLFGVGEGDWEAFPGVGVFNHEWWKPETFVSLGSISGGEVAGISGGMLEEAVDVRLNRLVVEHDLVVVCGPVFPHEVVGFSGGNKYFFPGVGGPEIIDLSHWLGALITNREIIGRPGITPVRRLIDRAAAMIPTEKLCLAMVVSPEGDGLSGLYAGTPEEAWAEAAALSARVHVRYAEKPFRRVLSVMPVAYEDMWTAAKGMYKLEPAVADGGEVVIYAPHITEFSFAHGGELAEVGYHVRDYFTKQRGRFEGYGGTVLAHSTHLKGQGSYDADTGEERPRVRVTLATGIPEERCRAHNVGYLDPDEVDPEEWRGREDEGVLLVPRAGETLYRLADEKPS